MSQADTALVAAPVPGGPGPRRPQQPPVPPAPSGGRPASAAADGPETPLPRDPRPAILFGFGVLAAVVFGIGGWSAYAPLSSGAVAPGVVVFEGRRQSVQHLEGGLIGEILVREGVEVERGDVLFRLDPTRAQSQVARLRNLLVINEAQAIRLMAELNNLDTVEFPEDLQREAEAWGRPGTLERERAIFEERRGALAGQIALLEAQAGQIGIEIEGLDVQRASHDEQLVLLAGEIADLRILLANDLVPRTRVTALEREAARLRGLNGDITARRARAHEEIAESRLQIEQLRRQFRQELVGDLRETENQIGDLRAQLVAALDVLDRAEIRAPQSGRVQDVAVTTVGSVVQPGQALLEIAPLHDRLMVEARVEPQDIDAVRVGQRAEVLLSALNLRMTPAVFGTVQSVSGDRVVDQRAMAEYFLVQIDIPPSELEKLGGQVVQAGMPAEVILATGERTLIQYLVGPLSDALRRGLLER